MSVEAVVSNSPQSRSREATQRVLVVDDEQGLRDLVCRTLQAEGFNTLEAAHGAEALALIENASTPVDLVVTDVVMPGMDGRELGRRLGQRWPDLPILYISAYDVNDIFRRGSPRDSAPFLQKPFPLDGLVTVVRGLLSGRTSS
ncbi:MAG TPA: response regulator [Gemmatimonadales bacterium]|nr:response regulator [Gemmatimonadales bacterium]